MFSGREVETWDQGEVVKLESKIWDVSKAASIGSRYMGRKVDLSAGSKEGFRVALEGDGKLSLF